MPPVASLRLLLLAVIVVSVLYFPHVATGPASADSCSSPIIQGDVNGSGTVTIADPQYLASFLLRLPANICDGDVDCDGNRTIGDAVKIARHLVGLPYSQHEPCPDIGQPIT